jgi:hypothetical protein
MHSAVLATLSAVVFAAGNVLAQQLTLPSHAYFQHTGSSVNTWRASALRFQVVYDTANFVEQRVNGPIAIQRLRWRAADSAVDVGGAVFATVNVHLSSCPHDWTALSTAFAGNRGPDELLCYQGPVTVAPCAGTAPNNYVVDIALQTPFTYDPTLGADLEIEVDATAPVPSTGIPVFATTSGRPGERAARVMATSNTATSGTTSAFASDLLVDFAGPGGYPGWTQATSVNHGTGCYTVSRSFYELFPSVPQFDLANTTVVLTPNGNGGYSVATAPSAPFFAHGPLGLGLGDESVSVQPLPASGFPSGLPYPCGSASVLGICSNGYIWLGSSVLSDFTPTVGELLAQPARLAPFWADLFPDQTHDVYFDVDPSGNTVYVTWDQVQTFEIGGSVGLQVAIANTGTIQFRYGPVSGAPTTPVLVGWSPGGGAVDPGARNLSASMPFSTAGPDSLGLSLDATPPLLGATVVETVHNVPAAALLTARLIGTVPAPGTDLGSLGAPGCALWIDTHACVSAFFGGTPTVTATLAIPNLPLFAGVVVITQMASFVPGVNALGLITSNQNVLTVGDS